MKALLLAPVHGGPQAKGGGVRYAEVLARHLADVADVAYATLTDLPTTDLASFDVVHLSAPNWDALRAVKRARRPKVVLTVHGSPLGLARLGWRTGRGGVYRAGQLAVYARDIARTSAMMAQAHAVTPVSRCTLADLVRQDPFSKRKMFLNENGVDADRFTPEGAGDDGFVLYVGRLEVSKGVDTLVDSLSGTDHRLVVAGKGALDAELRARAGPNVAFEGEVTDERLLELYRRASVCVFPSLYEGFGLVALESLACGTPTAVTDAFCVRGPAADLLEWFPAGDAGALRRAVDACRGRKTPEWSATAASTVREHHHVRGQAEDLVRLYESLAAGEGVPGARYQTV